MAFGAGGSEFHRRMARDAPQHGFFPIRQHLNCIHLEYRTRRHWPPPPGMTAAILT